MIKANSLFFLIVGFLAGTSSTVAVGYWRDPQQSSGSSLPALTKTEVARQVLSQSGIAQRYDLHFDHLMGTLIGFKDDLAIYSRFRKMFIREVGWLKFQDEYVRRLTADFSEAELQELLSLSTKPVTQKLLQSEVKAYMDSAKQRYRMGYDLWDKYNKGDVKLPD
jgi:hypothetical protein